jgi:DNA-binding winged helix-turn-helix (wHTH) protein
MEAKVGRDRISLVVEPKSATVIVAGRRIALPAKQFALMRELTADPGAALEASELIARVWEGRPGMTSSDLHALVWRLRRRIGDTGSEPQVIVNRKGLGYLIDIEAVEVTVMEGPGGRPGPASTAAGEDAAEPRFDVEAPTSDPSPRLDQRVAAVVERAEPDTGGSPAPAARVRSAREEGAVDPMAPIGGAASEVPTSGSREVDARHEAVRPAMYFGGKSLRWWIAAAAVVLAVGAVGFLGGLVTSETPEADDGAIAAEPEPTASPPQADPGRRPPKDKSRRPSRSQPPSNPGGGSGASGAGVAAAPPVAAPAPHTAPPAASAPRQHKPPPKRQPVALPPPPTRYLYHLYNAENGDHFVTTDGGAVTEHEAKGYEGGAIARVYVAPEKDTKAIALNYGSAFIFIDAAPKTNPASTTVALWLAKNNAGDFFYSTSDSEASQGEWSASLIGYVRTL